MTSSNGSTPPSNSPFGGVTNPVNTNTPVPPPIFPPLPSPPPLPPPMSPPMFQQPGTQLPEHFNFSPISPLSTLARQGGVSVSPQEQGGVSLNIPSTQYTRSVLPYAGSTSQQMAVAGMGDPYNVAAHAAFGVPVNINPQNIVPVSHQLDMYRQAGMATSFNTLPSQLQRMSQGNLIPQNASHADFNASMLTYAMSDPMRSNVMAPHLQQLYPQFTGLHANALGSISFADPATQRHTFNQAVQNVAANMGLPMGAVSQQLQRALPANSLLQPDQLASAYSSVLGLSPQVSTDVQQGFLVSRGINMYAQSRMQYFGNQNPAERNIIGTFNSAYPTTATNNVPVSHLEIARAEQMRGAINTDLAAYARGAQISTGEAVASLNSPLFQAKGIPSAINPQPFESYSSDNSGVFIDPIAPNTTGQIAPFDAYGASVRQLSSSDRRLFDVNPYGAFSQPNIAQPESFGVHQLAHMPLLANQEPFQNILDSQSASDILRNEYPVAERTFGTQVNPQGRTVLPMSPVTDYVTGQDTFAHLHPATTDMDYTDIVLSANRQAGRQAAINPLPELNPLSSNAPNINPFVDNPLQQQQQGGQMQQFDTSAFDELNQRMQAMSQTMQNMGQGFQNINNVLQGFRGNLEQAGTALTVFNQNASAMVPANGGGGGNYPMGTYNGGGGGMGGGGGGDGGTGGGAPAQQPPQPGFLSRAYNTLANNRITRNPKTSLAVAGGLLLGAGLLFGSGLLSTTGAAAGLGALSAIPGVGNVVGGAVSGGLGLITRTGSQIAATGFNNLMNVAQASGRSYDTLGFLQSIPGFGRKFEGLGVIDQYAGYGAGVELPNMIAGHLQGTPGRTPANQGNFKEAMDILGLDPASAAQFSAGVLQAAGGGGMYKDPQTGAETRAMLALLARAEGQGFGGGAVAGLIGGARTAGLAQGGLVEFNFAARQGARGSVATGMAGMLQGLTNQELASGMRYNRGRIAADVEGFANFQNRGAAFGIGAYQRTVGINRAAAGLSASVYGNMAQSLLFAAAMDKAGGDQFEANRILEQARPTEMLSMLKGTGASDQAIKMSLLAGGMTTSDVQALLGGKFIESIKSGGIAAPSTEASLKVTPIIAKAQQTRLDRLYDTSGGLMEIFDKKVQTDLKVEDFFIGRTKGVISTMDDLIKSVEAVTEAFDQVIITLRDAVLPNITGMTSGTYNTSASYTIPYLGITIPHLDMNYITQMAPLFTYIGLSGYMGMR